MGGIIRKGKNIYSRFSFFTPTLKQKYVDLKGFVELEVQIPIEYEKVIIDKGDVHKTFTINNQKVKVLELDENTMHLKLFDTDEEKFKIVFEGINSFGSTSFSEHIYNKFRENQNFDYNAFEQNIDYFELKSNLRLILFLRC